MRSLCFAILHFQIYFSLSRNLVRDEDPDFAKNLIRGCVIQTKEDF